MLNLQGYQLYLQWKQDVVNKNKYFGKSKTVYKWEIISNISHITCR